MVSGFLKPMEADRPLHSPELGDLGSLGRGQEGAGGRGPPKAELRCGVVRAAAWRCESLCALAEPAGKCKKKKKLIFV